MNSAFMLKKMSNSSRR